MKPKSLIPLVIVFVVLALAVMMKKGKEPEYDLADEVELHDILPDGISESDIAKLELYDGSASNDKLTLAWNAEEDAWYATSHFNAPVKDSKIQDYLKDVVQLKGEFRSSVAQDDALEAYNLQEDQAFHLVGYKKDADAPAFHLLIGTFPGQKSVFMRTDGEKDVYVEDTNLRQLAGVYGNDTAKAPEAEPWLDKQIVDFDKDQIEKITLKTPDKALTFELEAKPIETPAPEGDVASEVKPQPEVEYEWKLTEGGLPGMEYKVNARDGVLRKLDSLSADTIVDPSTKAGWGLDTPAFTCTVKLKDDPEEVVIEGGRPDPAQNGYVRVANDDKDIVYELGKYNFEQLWPKGNALYDALPKLDMNKDDLTRIEVAQPEGNIVLVKKDDAWSVRKPRADLEVLSTTLDTIARTLASWKAEDYADSAEGTGLDSSKRRVTFKSNDESHTIVLGNESKSINGAYAKLDDGDLVLAMSRMNMDSVFIAPKDLYNRDLFDFDAEEVKSIQIRRDEDGYFLERKDDGTWTVTIDGQSADAQATGCEDLAQGVAELEASDIQFGKGTIDGDTLASVSLTLKGGKSHTLTLGVKGDDGYPLAVAGRKQAFIISPAEIRVLLPASETLKKPKPVAPAKADTPADAEEVEASAATPIEVEVETAQ